MGTTKTNIAQKILGNKNGKILLIIAACILAIAIGFCEYLTSSKTINGQEVELFIKPEDNIKTVKSKLLSLGVLSKGNTSFGSFAKALRYNDKNLKAGRYVIKPECSVVNLVRLLRSGNQTPLKLTVLNARTAQEFADKITKNLMMTSTDLMQEISDRYPNHINEVFEDVIPDTYEVYWTVKPSELLDKFRKHSDKFWFDNKEKAKLTGFTKKDIVILASIVNEETNKTDEMPVIAGVYVNRLHKNMLLQADPTVKFAVGDFSLKRIVGKHLQTDSPFNTYKVSGLPPAPICLPSVASLKAVLKYEKHSYVYFCAKEDFSGYHNFAVTSQEHVQNAIRYRKALNERGIK